MEKVGQTALVGQSGKPFVPGQNVLAQIVWSDEGAAAETHVIARKDGDDMIQGQ